MPTYNSLIRVKLLLFKRNIMPDTEATTAEKKSSKLWTIVAVLVLAILLAVSYKLKDFLKPSVTTTAVLNESCDLRKGSCTSELPDGGKVTLSINPNDIPILRPLTLQVQTEGVDASTVEVDFIGIGMEMGYNRPKLGAVDKENFKGEAILPVCVRSKMDWEARVLLKTDKGTIMAPFRFFTTK